MQQLKKEYSLTIPSEIRTCEISWEKAKDKRESTRKELENMRKHLEVLVDVKMLNADLAEAENLCRTIEEKDRELLDMMSSKDDAKKDWLKNWVNAEVHDLMLKDRVDVRNHIEIYSDDLSKLSKIIEKFQHL